MKVLESLIGAVRRCCAGFPDQRTGTNVRYSMADIGMGAFSLFFVQSPSFLDFQRRLEAGHGQRFSIWRVGELSAELGARDRQGGRGGARTQASVSRSSVQEAKTK